jgi:hypothetical protein
MARSVSARAIAGVVLLVSVAACGSTAAGSSPAATTTATPTPPPSIATTPAPTAPPSAAAASTIFDTTSLGTAFDLPMTIDVPTAIWKPLPPPMYGPAGSFGFVHTGTPPEDDTQWWGAGLMLVDGASVADPGSMDKPATAADSKKPWPASYVDYLAALPGVTVVDGPNPVTIGGVEGRQIVVNTPPMHPTIFLKGDTMWMGGGPSGIDPALTRELTELTVGGKHVIVEYVDGTERFADNRPLVDAVLKTVTFPTTGS